MVRQTPTFVALGGPEMSLQGVDARRSGSGPDGTTPPSRVF
jgi:hypothetical protein